MKVVARILSAWLLLDVGGARPSADNDDATVGRKAINLKERTLPRKPPDKIQSVSVQPH